MKTGGLTAAICVASVLAGCVTSKLHPVVYRPSSTSQKLIEFKTGGYARRSRFVANDTYACYEEYRWKKGPTDGDGFVLEYQVQYVPSANEWKKFWRAIDKLELARWRSRYSQAEILPPLNSGFDRVIITDASWWTLTLLSSQNKMEFRGDGASPVAGHPESHATANWNKDALQPLEAAFRELVGLPQL